MTRAALALLLFAAALPAADYLPLAVGNRWTLSSGSQEMTLRVAAESNSVSGRRVVLQSWCRLKSLSALGKTTKRMCLLWRISLIANRNTIGKKCCAAFVC